MAWNWWFTAPIDAINAIGIAVQAIPGQILSYLVDFVIALLYPVSLIIYYLQNIYTVIYNSFTPIYNMTITIGNLPILILDLYSSIPTPWLVIFYMSLTLSVTVRLIRWLRTIPVLGRFLFGTGDAP